jgi:protein SCO1
LSFALIVPAPAIAQQQPGWDTGLAPTQGPVQNIAVRPDLLKDVGIDQKLNQSLPLDLIFRDEHGHPVALRQFFGQKPVILTLVYYSCPMLCTQVLNGVLDSIKQLSLNLGKDFTVVTVSIDPTERPVLAEAKQDVYIGLYGRPVGPFGWHFLTGDQASIKALAAAVGFRYAYDPVSKQFAHASTIMILTPQGTISRYLFGIQYPPRDMRLALVEASQGKIGTFTDHVLLFCYHYDPNTGKYGLLVSRILKLAAGLTVLAIAAMIFALSRSRHFSLPERRA